MRGPYAVQPCSAVELLDAPDVKDRASPPPLQHRQLLEPHVHVDRGPVGRLRVQQRDRGSHAARLWRQRLVPDLALGPFEACRCGRADEDRVALPLDQVPRVARVQLVDLDSVRVATIVMLSVENDRQRQIEKASLFYVSTASVSLFVVSRLDE